MREIEILAPLQTDLQAAEKILSRFEYKGNRRTKDTYFYDPVRPNLKQNANGKLMECCRLREKDAHFYATYKVDHYRQDVWVYSDEYETEIKDITAMENIFRCLGLEKLVVVNNVKHTYETPEYEIVVEEVENLGNFIEVEAKNDDETIPADTIKNRIFEFLQNLGLKIGAESNAGKPEMLLNKEKKS